MADSIPIPVATPESTLAVTVAIGAMLVVSAAVGIYFFRKAKNFDEWMVGHRDIGPIVTGLALVATWLSGWAIFGNAGLSYTYGWTGSWLIGTMNLMGLSLCVVMGLRMRRYAAIGARTVPEVAKVRFDSRLVQALCGIAMIILLIVYSVGQFKAMGAVWSLTTGTNWLWSGIITAALCAVYLAIGGYTGTQFSLAIQGGIFMVIGWIFGIASIFWAGGPDKIASSLANSTFVNPGTLNPMSYSMGNYTLPFSQSFAGYDWLGVTATLFMFLFMATGFPHNIARFLGCRKITKRDYSILMLIVAVGCVTPLMVGAMGLAARSVWGADLMIPSMKPILGDAAASLVSMAIGGSVGGAIFSMAVFAAAVSTLAGMVMVMTTNVTRDLIQTIRPKTSSRGLLHLSRLLIIPFIVIPLYWYLAGTPPVLAEFMSGSAVAQGGIFFFVIAFSMYWKRATKWGAVAAITYGLVMTLLHPSVLSKFNITFLPFSNWGVWALTLMFGCALVYIGVSLVTKPLPEDKLAKLFSKGG